MKANQLGKTATRPAVHVRVLLLGMILAGVALSWVGQPVLNRYYEAVYGAQPGAKLTPHLRS